MSNPTTLERPWLRVRIRYGTSGEEMSNALGTALGQDYTIEPTILCDCW